MRKIFYERNKNIMLALKMGGGSIIKNNKHKKRIQAARRAGNLVRIQSCPATVTGVFLSQVFHKEMKK